MNSGGFSSFGLRHCKPGPRDIELAPGICAFRATFLDLPPWERARLRVVAVARSRPRSVVVGRSAARLHGIPLLLNDGPVDLCMPSRSAPRLSNVPTRIQYRAWKLPPNHVQTTNGIHVTTFNRTLADVARTSCFEDGVMALDYALRERSLTKRQLKSKFEQLGPIHGIRRLRAALVAAIPLAGSPLESAARAQLLSARIPEIHTLELQKSVSAYVEGSHFFIDIVINGWLAIEIDGKSKYQGELAAQVLREERRREAMLHNSGFLILRFGFPQLRHEPGEESTLVRVVRANLQYYPGRGPARILDQQYARDLSQAFTSDEDLLYLTHPDAP